MRYARDGYLRTSTPGPMETGSTEPEENAKGFVDARPPEVSSTPTNRTKALVEIILAYGNGVPIRNPIDARALLEAWGFGEPIECVDGSIGVWAASPPHSVEEQLQRFGYCELVGDRGELADIFADDLELHTRGVA